MSRGNRTWIPPTFGQPQPPAPNPIDARRRDYILVLVRALEKHIEEANELDEELVDRIERLLGVAPATTTKERIDAYLAWLNERWPDDEATRGKHWDDPITRSAFVAGETWARGSSGNAGVREDGNG